MIVLQGSISYEDIYYVMKSFFVDIQQDTDSSQETTLAVDAYGSLIYETSLVPVAVGGRFNPNATLLKLRDDLVGNRIAFLHVIVDRLKVFCLYDDRQSNYDYGRCLESPEEFDSFVQKIVAFLNTQYSLSNSGESFDESSEEAIPAGLLSSSSSYFADQIGEYASTTVYRTAGNMAQAPSQEHNTVHLRRASDPSESPNPSGDENPTVSVPPNVPQLNLTKNHTTASSPQLQDSSETISVSVTTTSRTESVEEGAITERSGSPSLSTLPSTMQNSTHSHSLARFLAQLRKYGLDVLFPQSVHDKVSVLFNVDFIAITNTYISYRSWYAFILH